MPTPAHDFAGIYEEHLWRVYGFFAYRQGSRTDAEDLTQQTFERALRAWHRYDETRASHATWLLAIARNLLIDHLRSDRSARLAPFEELDPDSIEAEPDRYRVGIEPDLERALTQLSTRDRELIALRFGGELSGPEIAELTELSLANVQQILSRALRQMRHRLDAERAASELPAATG